MPSVRRGGRCGRPEENGDGAGPVSQAHDGTRIKTAGPARDAAPPPFSAPDDDQRPPPEPYLSGHVTAVRAAVEQPSDKRRTWCRRTKKRHSDGLFVPLTAQPIAGNYKFGVNE